MMAPVLIALAATPMLLALWAAAWLVGDLFAGPVVTSPIRVRSDDDPGR
jgi:hypothetical protein